MPAFFGFVESILQLCNEGAGTAPARGVKFRGNVVKLLYYQLITDILQPNLAGLSGNFALR